jgi:NAD(P)H-flavin reductase
MTGTGRRLRLPVPGTRFLQVSCGFMVTAPLLEITAVTPRSRLLVVDLSTRAVGFKAGQAVLVGWHGEPERRPYSIACSPEASAEQRRIELLISLDAPGEIARRLPEVARGTLVDVEGPLGTFIFPEVPMQPRLLFVAGGTGIAPLRAMIDHALRHHADKQLSLLYSVRRPDEFAFLDELRRHEAGGRLELHVTVTRDDLASAWAGGRGRIGRAHFEQVLHEPAGTLCFVCGPPLMVRESVATLKLLGVPESQLRTEGWTR